MHQSTTALLLHRCGVTALDRRAIAVLDREPKRRPKVNSGSDDDAVPKSKEP